MGIDAGFDMVPNLSNSDSDRRKWSRFLTAIRHLYQYDCKVEFRDNDVIFRVGDRPKLPFEGHKFLRFSSIISGPTAAATYIHTVSTIASMCFGARVRPWNEAFDQHGYYTWGDIIKMTKSFEEPEDSVYPAYPTMPDRFDDDFFEDGDPTEPLYEIREIPGRGKGVVARRNIPKGTRIICESPLTTANPRPCEALEVHLENSVKDMSKEDQRDFLSLHNNFPGPHPFTGICRTNALPCGVGVPIVGIYRTSSRINHSCLPNSQHNWNSNLRQETIHAIRRIRRGEEITICYSGDDTFAVRQRFLSTNFGFVCTCEICSLPSRKLQQSDNRRLLIKDLDYHICDSSRMANRPEDSLRDCHSLQSIIMTEFHGIASLLMARLYSHAFEIANSHGDQARASVFAERSYNTRLIYGGDDTPDAKRARASAEHPEKDKCFEMSSTRWRTEKGEVPYELEGDDFEDWLFREDV